MGLVLRFFNFPMDLSGSGFAIERRKEFNLMFCVAFKMFFKAIVMINVIFYPIFLCSIPSVCIFFA